MSNPTSQPNGAPPKPGAESPTRHGLTGAEAVAIVSAIRAILWRVSGACEDVDTFDPDKEQNIESLEAIVATLEDAGLAPLDWSEYQDVVLRREPKHEVEELRRELIAAMHLIERIREYGVPTDGTLGNASSRMANLIANGGSL